MIADLLTVAGAIGLLLLVKFLCNLWADVIWPARRRMISARASGTARAQTK